MDGPGGYYAKWSKSDKERQILCGITYTWNLKIRVMSNRKQIHRYRDQTSGYQWGVVGMGKIRIGDQEVQTIMYLKISY